VIDIYSSVANAEVFGSGTKIRDGKGRLILNNMYFKDGFKGTFFIADLVVEESQKIPVVSEKTGEKLDVEPNAPGTSTSFVVQVNNPKNKGAEGYVLDFVMTLQGLDHTQMKNEEKCANIKANVGMKTKDASPKVSPLRGATIDYETYRKVADKSGKELVVPKWSHVKQTPEDILARRQIIESSDVEESAE
jgi:hypothetical protein